MRINSLPEKNPGRLLALPTSDMDCSFPLSAFASFYSELVCYAGALSL